MGSAVAQALIITVVTVMLMWIGAVAALVFITVRGVRRVFRAGRTQMHRMVAFPASSSRTIGTLAPSTSATVGSPGWWATQHNRHRMLRAVSAAEAAVAVATRAGAPVGELPTLVRELVTAASRVDAVARASASSRSMRRDARNEQVRIETTAADLHRAAVESLKMVAECATDQVVSAARAEADALAAGLRAGFTATAEPAYSASSFERN